MKNSARNLRSNLLILTALTAAGTVAAIAARAQSAPTTIVVPTTPADNAYETKKVHIIYQKLLLREKDIPNAVTELGPKQVKAANPTTGSIQTLLTQAPSVVAYSQQPGQDSTTLAIRGVRNNELSETLDGVPINSLANGSGNYLDDGTVGSPVTLNEIDGVTIYPGLAPPAKQGFGTTGGTIAYTTKQPTDDPYAELEGGIGSFDTQHIGFVLNSGDIGTGPDAAKVMMLYDQSQTAGYVDDTKAQFHDFMLNAVKPYDDGLSKVGLVIIFNQGKALVQTLPTPTALIQAYGYKFNYPLSDAFFRQTAQDLTTILSDETYINKYAIFDGSLFYLHQSQTTDSYESADAAENGYTYNGVTYAPNVQALYQFYGCIGGPASAGNSLYGPTFTYDPTAAFGSCAAGESDEYSFGHENTIGITPKLTLFPDDYNTIVIGGLLAKTSQDATGGGAASNGEVFIYGGDGANSTEIPGYNSFGYGGGAQRTVFSGYAQDTIRLLNNKLQITPGVKIDAAYSSNIQQTDSGQYDPQKLQNFTKIGGYYLGASYDLPHNFVLFGSLGKGSLFAPLADYSESTTTSGIPNGTNTLSPEIVHLFEGGLRYDTPRLLLSADYYYQAIANGFAFYDNAATNTQYYGNTGGYLFRGVEGNGDFVISPGLSVFGDFSYNKAEYTKTFFASDTLAQDQYGYAFSGTPLSNVPDWDGQIGVDYEVGPFSAYATGLYTGREFTTYDEDAQPYGNTYYAVPPPAGSPAGTPGTNDAQYPYGAPTSQYMGDSLEPASPYDAATVTDTKKLNPANFVVNLLLTYDIPVPHTALQSLTASLNLQNILDERYYTYTYSSENPVQGVYDPHLPGGAPYDSAFVGEPRSISFDLTAKF